MPRTKKLPKDAHGDCVVVLKDWRINGDSSKPELSALLDLHVRPVTVDWAYLQKFDDLLTCYALLNQVKGSLALVNVALESEIHDPALAHQARRQLDEGLAMVQNAETSIEVVGQVLRERGFRRA